MWFALRSVSENRHQILSKVSQTQTQKKTDIIEQSAEN
jgi:hypothetical protein